MTPPVVRLHKRGDGEEGLVERRGTKAQYLEHRLPLHSWPYLRLSTLVNKPETRNNLRIRKASVLDAREG